MYACTFFEKLSVVLQQNSIFIRMADGVCMQFCFFFFLYHSKYIEKVSQGYQQQEKTILFNSTLSTLTWIFS
jgi:hypothetical protein